MSEDRYVKEYITSTMREAMLEGGVVEHVHRVECSHVARAIERLSYQITMLDIVNDKDKVTSLAREIFIRNAKDVCPEMAVSLAEAFYKVINSDD